MSLDRMNVWYYHFRNVKTATCLCCQVAVIHRDSKDWEAGHIIPKRAPLNGAGIYQNVRPICCDCNDKDRYYDSNYDYMVAIGTMKEQDVEPALEKIRVLTGDNSENPNKYRCIAPIASRKSRHAKCQNLKLPHNDYCGVHAHLGIEARGRHIGNICRSLRELIDDPHFEDSEVQQFRSMFAIASTWATDFEQRKLIGTTSSTKKDKPEESKTEDKEESKPKDLEKGESVVTTSKSCAVADKSAPIQLTDEEVTEELKSKTKARKSSIESRNDRFSGLNLEEFHIPIRSKVQTKGRIIITTECEGRIINTIAKPEKVSRTLNNIATSLRKQIEKQYKSASVSIIKVQKVGEQNASTKHLKFSTVLELLKDTDLVPRLLSHGIVAETLYTLDEQQVRCQYYSRVVQNCGISVLHKYIPLNKRSDYEILLEIDSPQEFERIGIASLKRHYGYYVPKNVLKQIYEIVGTLYRNYSLGIKIISLSHFAVDDLEKVRFCAIGHLYKDTARDN